MLERGRASSPGDENSQLHLLDRLRHTTATLLLSQGVTPKVVAERLGNDVQTLLRHYAHVLPGQQEEAAELLDGLLFRDS